MTNCLFSSVKLKIFFIFIFIFIFFQIHAHADFQFSFPNIEEPTQKKEKSKNNSKIKDGKNNETTLPSQENKNQPTNEGKNAENSSPNNDLVAKHNSTAPVYFQSENGNGSKKTGILNLVGSVVIIQDDTTLTSNKAQIIGTAGNLTLTGSKSVQKAIATGNVHIHKKGSLKSQEVKATADKIEFFVPERTMLLQGKAKVWKGQEFLNADIMEIDLNTGEIKLKAPHGTIDPKSANTNQKSKNDQKKRSEM